MYGRKVADIATDPLDAFKIIVKSMKEGIMPYKTDMEVYGFDDVWENPEVALERGDGDCETNAFAVCQIINSLPQELRPEQIRVAVGQTFLEVGPFSFPTVDAYHAWVETKIDGNWYVGDGTIGKVYDRDTCGYKRLFVITGEKCIPVGEI